MGRLVTPVAPPLSSVPPPHRVLGRVLPVTLAMLLVLGAGIVHGRWTHRWTASQAIEDAAARLRQLPMTIGDWQGEVVELDRQQLEVGGIAGYVARRYENRLTRETFTILVVCGPPGPISVHTPDVCYAGAGFELRGSADIDKFSLGPSRPPAEFRNGLLHKSSTPWPTYLRILWSWSRSPTGPWKAPDNPRMAFASNEVLHKLYVIRPLATPNELAEDDPSPKFLQLFLPVLEQTLTPAAEKVAERRGDT